MADRGLEFRDVHKSFGAVRALRGVSFAVAAGESHGLVGENGAGKSTLLKILGGLLPPDRGEIAWDGRRLALGGPRDALAHGIGLVYQETLAFPNLTVSGNIFAGRELVRPGGWLDERRMQARTRELLARLQLDVPPDAPMDRLSLAQCQLVQVARALAFDCRVLVLDEPTTALTSAESDRLFGVLGDLRARGVTLVYVSHRLPEVFTLCSRITVLRDGGHVCTVDRDRTSPDAIVRAMVGRDLPPPVRDAAPARTGEPVLRVRGLTREPAFERIDLELHQGEVLGLFGLVGSGCSELLETLFGLHAAQRGAIELRGAPLPRGARAAARAGLALVPEDRQRQGLLFNLSVADNLALPRSVATRTRLIDRRAEAAVARALVDSWRIRTPAIAVTPDRLSGGNQQKVVLAKWLAIEPRVLLLDEPTKGVDVGAKYEIHEIVRRHAARGGACLLTSTDLPEVLALAHRILVMRAGRLRGELAAGQADEASVMRLATAAEHAA
jgi:rhamnose transport system ATP-binding protein